MTNTSRKVALRSALNELAPHFERAGWRLVDPPGSMLNMTRNPAPDVAHTLLVNEPFRPANLPADDVLGLACDVLVYFPELETAINSALGRDTTRQAKLSLSLALSRLAPGDHLYAGAVYLIALDPDLRSAVAPMIRDFETYLEPVRAKVSATSVFSEPNSPPELSGWKWDLLRAAYCRLHADTSTWQELFAQFEARAEAVLATEKPDDPGRSFVFTDLRAVQRKQDLRGAEEMLRFIGATR